MKKINNPNKLWSDSFITDGHMTVSINPDTNEFDSHCVKMLHLNCIEAYYDDNGKLHLIFDVKN